MRVHLLAIALVALLATGIASAAPSGFTDPTAFTAALPAPATTVDFESAAPGVAIPSGSSQGAVAFSYDFGGVEMAAYDAFPSTSGTHGLGTQDARVFQDGDAFAMSFDPAHAIGLYVVTRDALVDGDITLTASGATASLASADLVQTLSDGSRVFFLGIVDPTQPFTGASLDFPADGDTNFVFNLDDVVIALPEPGGAPVLGAGVLLLAALARRRRA